MSVTWCFIQDLREGLDSGQSSLALALRLSTLRCRASGQSTTSYSFASLNKNRSPKLHKEKVRAQELGTTQLLLLHGSRLVRESTNPLQRVRLQTSQRIVLPLLCSAVFIPPSPISNICKLFTRSLDEPYPLPVLQAKQGTLLLCTFGQEAASSATCPKSHLTRHMFWLQLEISAQQASILKP